MKTRNKKMDDDLKVYEYQLEQVRSQLLEDPQNPELVKLRNDLEEAIRLIRELEGEKTYQSQESPKFSNDGLNKPLNTNPDQRKKKAISRAAYIARKEEEHTSKADAWKTFTTKTLPKKGNPSLFKATLVSGFVQKRKE